MRITDIQPSPILTLDRFKAYANIVDCTRDDELRAVVLSAALRVAQYADIALVACTVVEDVDGGGEAQLWMPPVSAIVSVIDHAGGEDIASRCMTCGSRIVLPDGGCYTVTYTVEPEDATVQSYVPLVWEMAVAMWDGNTDEEQKVYKRIPAGYVVH